MANYYDPKTLLSVAPSGVRSVTSVDNADPGNPVSSTAYFDPTGKEVVSGYGWSNWLQGEGARAGTRDFGKLNSYLEDLNKNYGLGQQDFVNGLKSYGLQYYDGPTDEYGNVNGFGRDPSLGWWGEDALIRVLGQGLSKSSPDAAYKDSWRNYWDQNAETAGQNDIANAYAQGTRPLNNVLDDLPSILAGVGLVTGVGGLAGAFGGIGGGMSAAGADAGVLGYGTGDVALNGLGGALDGATATGSFATADAGGVGGGSGAAPDVGVNPSVDAGSLGNASDLPATTGGNNMDWLDSIIEDLTSGGGNTGADVWANSGDGNVLDVLNTGDTTAAGTTTAGNASSASDVLKSYDTAAEWEAKALKEAGIDAPVGGLRQQLVDMGIPFDVASKIPTSNLKTFLDIARGLGGSGASANQSRNALSKIFSGSGTADDWTSLLGTLGTGALSAYSANKYADNMKEIADRSWNAGSNYRNKLTDTYTNPGAYLDSPEVKAITDRSTNALARSLSARDGNPIGSGRALNEINDYAGQTMLGQLGNYRQQLANFGGQSALSGNYSQLGSQSAEAGSNIYNSLANTVSRATQPQTDWASIMRQFGLSNSPV